MAVITGCLKRDSDHKKASLELAKEELDLPEKLQEGKLQGRAVFVETLGASPLLGDLWDRKASWSLLLPGGVQVYQAYKVGHVEGLDLKVITLFILSYLLFRSSSARHKEELQKAKAIERATIRAEHRARVHHAFENKARQIAAEEILRCHQQGSPLVVGTGAVMAQSGLSVYRIFTFPSELPVSFEPAFAVGT